LRATWGDISGPDRIGCALDVDLMLFVEYNAAPIHGQTGFTDIKAIGKMVAGVK
jgi:hypothetical protein